jgi:hypothetical protein
MGGYTGLEFLDKIFYISNGVMLTQIRDISGLDGSTLQNWVKRGWIGTTVNKRYSKDQLARILIINMLRDAMLLERIDFLLHYINGKIDDMSDDIISDSVLYDYICKIYDIFCARAYETSDQLLLVINEVVASYKEPVEGGKKRLAKALEIILIAYFASIVSTHANNLYLKLI